MIGPSERAPAAPDAGPAARLAAWTGARFPPSWLALLVPYYVAAGAWAAGGDLGALASPRAALGLPAFCAFFLLLRVVDEHQDVRPATPGGLRWSAGLVSLAELRWVGAVAVAVQVAFSLGVDRGVGAATAAWLALAAWAVLAGLEFLQPEAWTRRHSVAFALGHLLLHPAALGWMVLALRTAAGGPAQPGFAAGAALLAALAWLGGAVFEISRKTCGPGDPRAAGYTYSAVWGLGRAVRVQQALMLSLAACAAVTAGRMGSAGAIGVALDGAVLVALLLALARARALFRRPAVGARRRNERAARLLVVAAAWDVALRLVLGGP